MTGYPAVFYADLFVDNFVNDPVADGVLATVMVDTTGMIPGAYDLVIDSTIEGASALYSSGTPHIGGTFVNGTITITPEPATLFVLALGGLSIIRRHRPR